MNIKRLNAYLIIVIVGILVGGQQVYNIKKNNNKIAIETMGMPVSNKVVIIDAGHGKPDEGDSLLKLKSKG